MERITHSPKGLVRAMQMSKHAVFVFCEGKDPDLYIYTEILRKVESASGATGKVVGSHSLPIKKPGKGGLLVLYRYLRRRSVLRSDFLGKRTAVVFAFDKDADDVLGRKVRSDHAMYTRYYDIEAHVVEEGDVLRAVRIAGAVSEDEASKIIADLDEFKKSTVQRWVHWLTLCLISHRLRVSLGFSYGRMSTLNGVNWDAETSQEEYGAALLRIASCRGCDLSEIRVHEEFFKRRILASCRNGSYQSLFKGKWMFTIIANWIVRNSTPSFSRNGFGERFRGALLANLDFDHRWTSHFSSPIARQVAWTRSPES